MSNKVTFQIKIEGENELRAVTVDAKELGEAFSAVQARVEDLEGEMVTLASSFELLEGASDLVSRLRDTLSGFVAEFREDDLAESRLAQAMRNTMDASDEEIRSIKALAEAQERLGVVSAGVQLTAAQELATYLEYSDSLKTILPVLNDMVAQQLGIGASAESATQIATMLGKVMNGQTEALSRYGYKFDEAQKHILQFGDESERAAVLAEVVEQSVAGMNEALAKTPSGAIAQAKNEIDGIKASIGKAVSGFMPLISAFSEMAIAALGVAKLTKAVKALHLETSVAKVKALALAAAQQSQAAAARMLGISQTQAATATGVLRAQIVALQATMTLGLALAINLVISLLSKLFSKSGEAADGMEKVGRAEEAYRRASASARAETAADIVALEELIRKKGQEGEKVAELNRKYGDALGTYRTAAEWYDILTNKSKEYCRQLAYEAMAAEYKKELAAALKTLDEAEKKRDGTRKYKQKIVIDRVASEGDNGAYHLEETGEVTESWTEADAAVKAARQAVDGITESMSGALKKSNELAEGLKQSGGQTAASWEAMNLADLQKAIQEQRGLVESLAGGPDSGAAKAAAAELKRMEARARAIKAAYGLAAEGPEKSKTEELFDGSKLIENASSYKELGNNIKYYQNRLEEAGSTDAESVRYYSEKLRVLRQMQSAFKDAMDAEGLPAELNSLEDIDLVLTFLNSHRKKVSAENIADIDEQILRLRKLRDEMELAARPKPAEIGSLNTIDQLSEALSYYQELQQNASAAEIADIQAIINALNKKKSLLEGLASIPDMWDEVSGLNGMSAKELKVELNLIGLDEVRTKIRALKKMLKEPFYAAQQDSLKSLIGTYSQYENILKASSVKFSDGWSDIKAVGNGIRDITNALESNGDAWEKVTAVVDGFLQVCDGIRSVVAMAETLTTATKAQTEAKTAETVATEINTVAVGVESTAINANTMTAISNTGAKSGEAVAGAVAAGAAIPFPYNLIAIAAGVAAVIAALASVGSFATGGIVGGNSPTGDKLFARVNSGEMILNKRQQQRLLCILNGGALATGLQPAALNPAEINLNVDALRSQLAPVDLNLTLNSRIRGRDIVQVIDYENNIKRRS